MFLSDVLYEDSDNDRAAMKSDGDGFGAMGGLPGLEDLENMDMDASMQLEDGQEVFDYFQKEVSMILEAAYSEEED